MMGVPAVLALLLLSSADPQRSPQGSDELRSLARAGPESALVERARTRPDDVRDGLRALFIQAAASPGDSAGAADLLSAARLARAWAVAWHDSFLLRQVALFRSWSPAARRAKVTADSLRRAGNAALGRWGAAAAMRAWRRSLWESRGLNDSAGMAAALGNIGAGWYSAGDGDSAEAYYALARDLAGAIGDFRTLGNAVGALAKSSQDRGDLARAAELYAQSAGIRARTGDARGTAADRNNLGLLRQSLGDLDGARTAFQEALALNRGAGYAEPAALNLVNLGNVDAVDGGYADAAARYHAALAAYRDLGNRAGVGSVLHNLGLLSLRRGDYRAASRELNDALTIYEATGPLSEALEVRRGLAEARAAMGDLEGALGELRRAEQLARAGDAGAAALARLALVRADLAVQFNTIAEADRQYARAELLYRRAGDDAGRAEAGQGRGILLLMRENYAAARTVLEGALRSQQAAGDRRASALTRLLLGDAQRRLGDTAAARRTVTAAFDSLNGLGDPVGAAAALLALGDLEAQNGLPLASEALYQRGLARLGGRLAPDVAWQLHAGLGRALRERGTLTEAARELRAAAGEILRVSANLPLEERRADYLADKWDVYAQLALVEHARGRAAAAFEASEQLRARQMLDLLARGRFSPPARGANDTLTAREEDLRRRITYLTRRIEGAGVAGTGLRGPGLSDSASGAAREALARAQETYAELLLELRATRPEYATLVQGATATSAEVTARLAPNEALLEYLVTDSATIVFVATSDSMTAIDLDVTPAALTTLVDFVRGTLTQPDRPAAREVWRAALRRLYQELVAPVEAAGLLNGKRLLIIAPHGELHYLPFAALVRGGAADQYLIERFDIVYVPSASVWLRLGERKPPEGHGVLALAPHPRELPGSRAEVAAIGRVYGASARMLVGAEATELAFREAVAGRDIVHLATYGVLNKHNPLFSFVELAADEPDDGRLEVHEVFGMHLDARLVVLSACQTGLGSGSLADLPAGDDWVGLVRAFLFAGARGVLATLWPVEDRSTARLMERFYTALSAGSPEAAALADAQRDLLRNPGTTHPFYWAGFALVGGP